MKKFDNYRKFKKVVRKYWKKNSVKRVDYINHKKFISYWFPNIWCYHIVKHLESFHSNDLIYDVRTEDIPAFIDKTNMLIGKHVKNESIEGILNGIALTNNGAYYAITENDGSLSFCNLIGLTEV